MQLSLDLLESPPRPEATVWERLNEEERQAVAVELAGMILGAALGVVPDQKPADQTGRDKTGPVRITPDQRQRESADA